MCVYGESTLHSGVIFLRRRDDWDQEKKRGAKSTEESGGSWWGCDWRPKASATWALFGGKADGFPGDSNHLSLLAQGSNTAVRVVTDTTCNDCPVKPLFSQLK